MELKSHLGKWISEFLAFRAARGLSTKSHLANLAKLDSCCRRCNADANGLSKDAVSGWLCEMAGQCTKSRLYSMKISVRQLAKYMRAFGEAAYLLPCRLNPRPRSTFAPYMPADGELASLFSEIDRASKEKSLFAVPGTESVLFRLAYACGLRPGEGLSALTSDLDLDFGSLFVRESKGHRDRTVVFSEQMTTLMRKYMDARKGVRCRGPLNFPRGDGSRVGTVAACRFFRKCWLNVRQAASQGAAPRLRPYDLRHMFASSVLQRWNDQGENLYACLPALRAYMGHTHMSSTLYYVHLLSDRLRESPGVDWQRLNRLVPEV